MTFRNDKKSKKDITLLTNCPMCTLVRYSSGVQYGNMGCRIFKLGEGYTIRTIFA